VSRQFFSMLNGLRGDEDLCREPSFLAMQREKGVNTARCLLKVLGEIDDVLAIDLLGVEDAWPLWVNIRREYSGVHERFEPLRKLALVWKIDLTVAPLLGRPATGPGSYLTYPFESFQTALRDAYVRAQQKWARLRPTKEQVAEEMEPTTLSESALQRHIR
jgi:hypothetical protein